MNFAGFRACSALDAQFRINVVRLLFFSADGSYRAGRNAQVAAFALLLIDRWPQ